VIEVRPVSEGVFELALERGPIEFEPGSSFALYHPRGVSRPYSASSGCGEDCLRFLIRRVPGGRVSGWLAARRPGDVAKVSDPFGMFRPGHTKEPGEPSVFIATGTGIAPFLSALRSDRRLKLAACLYGVGRAADAVDVDFLATRCPLTVCVSRETLQPFHHGRVTDLLEGLPHRPNTNYFLCGLDRMIDQVGAWLEQHGISADRIHREVFFRGD
jgi:ferredoxin-NADP reductase